jgi:hypothetical protein
MGAGLMVLVASGAEAKRAPPADVAAIVRDGTRYEVPAFDNPCHQNGGCVVARVDATGEALWAVKVYCTHYENGVEMDAQDVFITALSLGDDGHLAVINEKGQQFSVDLAARTVTGDERGCPAVGGGCGYGPGHSGLPLLALAGLAALVRSRSRLAARSSK